MRPEELMSLHIDLFIAALFLSWGKDGRPWIKGMLGFWVVSYWMYKILK